MSPTNRVGRAPRRWPFTLLRVGAWFITIATAGLWAGHHAVVRPLEADLAARQEEEERLRLEFLNALSAAGQRADRGEVTPGPNALAGAGDDFTRLALLAVAHGLVVERLERDGAEQWRNGMAEEGGAVRLSGTFQQFTMLLERIADSTSHLTLWQMRWRSVPPRGVVLDAQVMVGRPLSGVEQAAAGAAGASSAGFREQASPEVHASQLTDLVRWMERKRAAVPALAAPRHLQPAAPADSSPAAQRQQRLRDPFQPANAGALRPMR